MTQIIGQWKDSAQLRIKKVHKFRQKVQVSLELGPYLLKTAETQKELRESFRLRNEVFNQEFRGINKQGLDVDKFDRHFDHLIILHKEKNLIVGTYRLNCSDILKDSYTALEFDLGKIFTLQGPFLELGRACIKKDYRKGAVISLLWRGIAEYMNVTEAHILFGCSSLKINQAREAALIYQYLKEENSLTSQALSYPTKKFRMKNFEAWAENFERGLTENQKQEADQLLPSLLKSYMKLGAKIGSVPAFDRDFDCIDLLTVLRRGDLAASLARRFQVNE